MVIIWKFLVGNSSSAPPNLGRSELRHYCLSEHKLVAICKTTKLWASMWYFALYRKWKQPLVMFDTRFGISENS